MYLQMNQNTDHCLLLKKKENSNLNYNFLCLKLLTKYIKYKNYKKKQIIRSNSLLKVSILLK